MQDIHATGMKSNGKKITGPLYDVLSVCHSVSESLNSIPGIEQLTDNQSGQTEPT